MKQICTFLIVLATGLVQAQDLTFTLGKKIKEQPYGNYMFFNKALSRTYVVNTSDEFKAIKAEQYINFDLKFTDIKFESVSGDQTRMLEGFYDVGPKNYLVYSEFSRKTGIQTVYGQEVSEEMIVLGSPVPMATFKDVKNENRTIVIGEKFIPYSNVMLVKSQHSNQVLILKKKDGLLDAVAFSPDKGTLWSKTFPMNTNLEINLSDIELTENGDLYITGYYSKVPLLSGATVIKDAFILFYSAEQKKHKLNILDDEDKIQDRGYTLEMISNKIVAVGLYNDKKTSKVGYKVFSFDPKSLSLVTMASRNFSEEFIKIVNRGVYDIDFFATSDIAQLDNGNIILAFTGGLTSSGKYSSTAYSTPVNIIALNEKGEEQWSTILAKYQTQPLGGHYVGHSLVTKGNIVYVIYNDHIANLNADPTQKPKETILKDKNTMVTAVRIDEQGKSKKTYPFGTSKTQKLIMDNDQTRRIKRGLYYFVFTAGEMTQLATLSTVP